MLNILIAPARFKGSLSALEAAISLEQGVKKVFPQSNIEIFPLADGGEGTVPTLIRSLGGQTIQCKVTGPLGQKVKASLGLVEIEGNKAAVLEMAAASGLTLVPLPKRSPLNTTTYGTGELILKAVQLGVSQVFLGLGDSATCDGGVGALQALGVSFQDKNGKEVGFGGKELLRVANIEESRLSAQLRQIPFTLLTDVDNLLLGKEGAAPVFAPQKGATPSEVKLLEKGLNHLAQLILKETGKDIAKIKGGGAAGGLGAGLAAFLKVTFQPGAEFILRISSLSKKLKGYDLIITGEGSFDQQSLRGKAPYTLLRKVRPLQKKVWLIAGKISLPLSEIRKLGVTQYLSLSRMASSKEAALKQAAKLLELAPQQLYASINNQAKP
jgi:glycerate kinase